MSTYNQLRPRRIEEEGAVVGLAYVDIPVAAFQVAADTTGAIVCTLPAAAGANDVPPALVVPAAGVGGTAVIGVNCLDAGGLDAGLGFAGAQVTLAGGPGVGQITLYVTNATAAAIPGAPAARTFRFLLDM